MKTHGLHRNPVQTAARLKSREHERYIRVYPIQEAKKIPLDTSASFGGNDSCSKQRVILLQRSESIREALKPDTVEVVMKYNDVQMIEVGLYIRYSQIE